MASLQLVNTAWCLDRLYESNYHKLLRLIPHLSILERQATAYADDKPPLRINVLDKAPYTLTVTLSYQFDGVPSPTPNGDRPIAVRVYWDARLAEALPPPSMRIPPQQALDDKWQRNYFLDRWLDHCLRANYCFPTAHHETLAM